MQAITLQVQGMSCSGCIASVTRVLRAVPGVGEVAVSLHPGEAKITYDPAQIDVGALRAAIEDAGYDVAN